jgi:transposase
MATQDWLGEISQIKRDCKQTSVVKESNHWYVCFSCEIERQKVEIKEEDTIGIDVGLEHFVTIASDEGIKEIKNPCFFRKGLLKIRYLSRKLSKKRLKSENRWKAKQKLIRHMRRLKTKGKIGFTNFRRHLSKATAR